MKKKIFFNSSNPFVFTTNEIFNTIELNSISFNLKTMTNDFIMELSQQINNKEKIIINYYNKEHYNIIGYGVLNNRNMDINVFQKCMEINPTNSISIYFRDIESREMINFENLNYIIDISYN